MIKALSKSLIIAIIMMACLPVFSQNNNGGIGLGMSFNYGANPKSDYMIWDFETEQLPLYAKSRMFIGPTVQYKNFQRIQAEASLLYSQSVFLGTENTLIPQNVTVNEWQLPVEMLLNFDSPIRFHSAIVYHAGVMVNHKMIPVQGFIKEHYSFTDIAFTAGVRLSGEIKSFGRIEYGISYAKNVQDYHSFMVQLDDARTSNIVLRQDTGLWRINVVYFFSPRTFKWSKNRYNLHGLE